MRTLKGYVKGKPLVVKIYSKQNKNKITQRKTFKSPTSAMRYADKFFLKGHAIKIDKK
jgi:hypothetical protein